MNPFKRVIAAAILAAAVVVAAGQSPRQRTILSADEILNIELADGFTHATYKDEETDEYLNERVNVRKVTLPSLLDDSLVWREIPVGFVPAASDITKDRVMDVDPSGLSVRDLLDAIVAADPRYKWSVEDGVVNLTPAAGRPALLDVRLAEFKGKASVGDLFYALQRTPEVRRRAAELGFDAEKPAADDENGFIIFGAPQPKYDISCRDCTVLEALNEIARRSGAAWMYREVMYNGKKDYYFSGLYAF